MEEDGVVIGCGWMTMKQEEEEAGCYKGEMRASREQYPKWDELYASGVGAPVIDSTKL